MQSLLTFVRHLIPCAIVAVIVGRGEPSHAQPSSAPRVRVAATAAGGSQSIAPQVLAVYCEAIVKESRDPGIRGKAAKYLDITSTRDWWYFNAQQGVDFKLVASYERDFFQNGMRWVKFSGYQAMPFDSLTYEAQQEITSLATLKKDLTDHYQKFGGKPAVTHVEVKAKTKVMVDGHPVDLAIGTAYEVLDRQANYYIIAVLGERVQVNASDVRPVDSTTVIKPPIDPVDTIAGLDVAVDFLAVGQSLQVKVTQVVEGGAGDEAGLRIGDVILKINGQSFASPNEFMLIVAGEDRLQMTIRRANRLLKITVKQGGESAATEKLQWPSFGVFGRTDQDGEFVVSVARQGNYIAAKMGIGRKDKVLMVNDRVVKDLNDIQAAVNTAGDTLTVIILREGETEPVEARIRLSEFGSRD